MTLAAIEFETYLPASFTAPGLSEREFLELCEQFPDCTLEYTADGEVVVMPPTDPETSKRVLEVGAQLRNWALSDSRGWAVGSDGGFFLPGGARRSPDAAWFASDRWAAARQEGTRFPSFAPEFVIEVRPPGQRARPLREKMDEYMENGVQLGWLIDPVEQTITIYCDRPGTAQGPEILFNPPAVRGEGPVEGFVLDTIGVLR